MRSPRLAFTLGALGALVALVGGGWAIWSGARRPPAEVRSLEAVLQRLSQGNDLGSQPLSFMVSSGTYTAQLAEQRGLCKPDHCDMFAQLNPYQRYGNGWDELIRQGYALGDIQGWSASSGTVIIPRAAFRAYGPHIGYLSCTVAHEIAHYQRHHVFEQSYHENHVLRGQADEQKKLGSMKESRRLELEADRDAATMLARAGYRGRVCQQELEFMHRSIGDGSVTEPESSHPGYEERIAAMDAHYDALEKHPPRPQPGPRGRTSYDSADNLLTWQPH